MKFAVSNVSRKTNLKPIILILAHMTHLKEVKDPIFAKSMETILKLAPNAITYMLEIAIQLNSMF